MSTEKKEAVIDEEKPTIPKEVENEGNTTQTENETIISVSSSTSAVTTVIGTSNKRKRQNEAEKKPDDNIPKQNEPQPKRFVTF